MTLSVIRHEPQAIVHAEARVDRGDVPFLNPDDQERLRAERRQAKALGLLGKAAHPR